MRILLVHPEDSAERGPWQSETWDRVVDLGLGGTRTYERWSRQFGCPAAPLEALTLDEFQRVRSLFLAGMGRLLDAEGLDWWELTAVFLHQQIELLVRLRRMAAGISPADQIFLTRKGIHGDALELLLGKRPLCYGSRWHSGKRGPVHYARALYRLSWRQTAEIFWDKYDAGYAVRGRFVPRRKPSSTPVVLLPSAYGNVSRMGNAYAKALPGTRFLLVATRSSGWVAEPSSNVSLAALASYAHSRPGRSDEYAELGKAWQGFQDYLQQQCELSLLHRLRSFDGFPSLLRTGLAIRDAWLGVLENEPAQAVLCADDTNPYSHIPLLLAGKRGLPTLACHHGALDGRHLFKRNHADIILAKGKMEQDYLERVCGVAGDRVEVGAPGELPVLRTPDDSNPPWIVFFSEGYEVSQGRAEEFYRELLPPLADLALSRSRRLVIKLHPSESLRERKKMAARVLSRQQWQAVTVMTGPLTEALLRKTWFGVTILSTAAMDCAVRAIPCFLAGWLEYWPYGYVEQFGRFGAGRILNSPAEVALIPEMLKDYHISRESLREIWQPIAPARLEELLSGSKPRERAVAV